MERENSESVLLQKAVGKTADYLSRRSHSEKELRDKLKAHFSPDLIDEALKTVKQKKWLEDPYELALQVKNRLDNKNKSWRYIKQYLQNKGLPLPDYDKEKEIMKIKNLLMKKQKSAFNSKESLKIKRFLSYRLFESELISQVMESAD